MPTISVVLPVHNGEKTIKDTIESVLNQSLKDLELIIIDDGSQDSTIQVVECIRDNRIKVFSYANAGLAASRNRGIHHATSEYVSFIDADDLWASDKLESQIKALQDYPQAAVAYSWTDYIDESGRFFRKGSYITATDNIYARLLLINFLENGSNPLIRKEVFSEVGYFDESLPAAEDWDMWFRLAARYEFVGVSSPQILYRISASSMSANVVRQEAACLKVLERAFAQAPEPLNHLQKSSIANLYKYLTFKAIQGLPNRQQSLTGARCFWYAVSNEPELLGKRVTWKILIKLAIVILLPTQLAQLLLSKIKQISNIDALLVHIQLAPE